MIQMKYSEVREFVRHLRDSASTDSGDRLRESVGVEDSPSRIVARIRRGMPIGEFDALAEWLDLTDDRLAPLLGLSRATLHRRRKSGHLDSSESERIVRFARLLGCAVAMFGDELTAREWLKSPAVAFGGESPLSFADTDVGAREVETLLGRLDHGVFS
jgi:putative toxin-antitoxin system antitoxin component (TIGR02293 family)